MQLSTGFLAPLRLAATSSVPVYGAVCWAKRVLLRQQIDFPHRGTDLCIEGYRSSGNTVATETVTGAWPQLSVASHRHSVAAVRRAAQLGKPILIMTRAPEEAISSCVVRFGWPLQFALADYVHFYEGTRDIPAIRHFSFERLLAQPAEFMALVHRLAGVPLPQAAQTPEDFRQRRSRDMEQAGVQPQNWWTPHPEKDKRKQAIKDQLPAHAELLARARSVHADLRAREARQDARHA